MFGDQNTNDLAQQLCALEEEFQLKKMTLDEYENAKVIKNSVSCMKCTPWNCRTLSFSLSLLADSIAVSNGKAWSLPVR